MAQKEEGQSKRRKRRHHSLLKPGVSLHAADTEACLPNPRLGEPGRCTGVNDNHSDKSYPHSGFPEGGMGPADGCEPSIPTFHDDEAKPFSFLSMIDSVLQLSDAAPVGLRSFLRLSMRPARNVHGSNVRPDLWPCPIPSWSWTAASNLSPARRRRRKLLQVRARALQVVIGVLNWESLGHPTSPPAKACVGFGFTNAQWDMVCRLERLVDHFLQPGFISSSTLGRSAEKFSSLVRVARELPEHRDVDLDELVHSLSKDFDPYSKPSSHPKDCDNGGFDEASYGPHPDFCTDPHPKVLETFGSDNNCQLSTCVAKPVVASRIKWEHSPQFDPIPFLHDKIVRDAFIDPSRVRLPEHLWDNKPRGKVHCSRDELLKLAEKWDSKGACKVFRKDEIRFDESVGIFAVPKDNQYDRLILNPQTANGRLKKFSHFTKELAPGSMFCLLRLEADQLLRISADDLAEMYYTIKVPEARAKRNSVGCLFDASELAHLRCFKSTRHYGPCVVALNALAMGDSWAVEFAQQAHHNVLRFLAGSMLEHERVAYRKAFPRSSFYEWLAIDDHIGVQVVTKDQFRNRVPLRDNEVFDRAEEAYKVVGLVQHPRKKQRHVTEGTFLGAEVDGKVGLVSAPKHRIGALMLCTVLVAKRGTATPTMLSALLGCWINVLMFRRPIFSVLSHVFSAGRGCKPNQLFVLDRQSRNELLAIALLGPVCMTDLRVDVAPAIYCTDASPDGGGICVCPEDPKVVSEMWRHCEQRGYYTQLLNPAASLLAEMNLEHLEEHLPDKTSQPIDSLLRVPPPLREGYLYDCIELFRGEGNWSLSHELHKLRVHKGLDIKGLRVAFLDLMDDSVFHQLLALALRRVIRDWHAGPPCKTFGTLRRPRIRSKRYPSGFNLKDSITREHNILALRTAFLMAIVVSLGDYFSVEQPGSSVMFYMAIFRRIVQLGCVITRMCFCAFGSPFKKPSQWLHNKPWLLELASPCRCESSSQHFVIQGTFTRASIPDFVSRCKPSVEALYGRPPRVGEAVSSYSASYPKTLCHRMAVGHVLSLDGSMPIIPHSAVVDTMKRLGDSVDLPEVCFNEPTADARPFHEDPVWVEELADALPWNELLRYRFKRSGHINVLECRVHKTWLKHCANSHPNSRVVGLLDSRVTIGATSKGRSSSRAICRVLQGSLGYIIGGCLYPGALHIGSLKNRSDFPSRNRPVPPPSKDTPLWLARLRAGDSRDFDTILVSAQFTKNAQRWLRLLLLLGGDIERNPGPIRSRAKTPIPRGPLDHSVGFVPATSKRMAACLEDFDHWLNSELGVQLSDICWDYTAAPLAIRAYGLHLFQRGAPRYQFVYTITGFQDRCPHMRPFLASAWQVDRKWQQYEPGECRPVISAPIMRAMTSIALLWKWYRWLGITLIGFLGMLHPAEFVHLTRRDVLLPSDSLSHDGVFYVHIRNPKTSRFARRQHCKIDELVTLRFIEKVFTELAPDEPLFPGGMTSYRRRWNLVLSRLGIPFTQQNKGATPAVLRGSGATHLYLQCEDLCRVQWRGRWSQLKTVEHYIQEVAAQTLMHNLSDLAKHRVRFLHEAAPMLLSLFLS